MSVTTSDSGCKSAKETSRMRVIIGADHAGFALKEKIKEVLEVAGHHVVDIGAPVLRLTR